MTKQRKLNIKPGTYVTNCNFTCHYPCYTIKKNSTVMQWKTCMIKIQNVSMYRALSLIIRNYYNLKNGYRFELKTLKLGLQMSLRKVLEGNRKRKTAQAMVDNIKRNSNVTQEDVKKKMKTVQSLLALRYNQRRIKNDLAT